MSHLFTERPVQHYATAITDEMLVSDDKATRRIQRSRQCYGCQEKNNKSAERLSHTAEDMHNISHLSQHTWKSKGSRIVSIFLYQSGINKNDGIHSAQFLLNL